MFSYLKVKILFNSLSFMNIYIFLWMVSVNFGSNLFVCVIFVYVLWGDSDVQMLADLVSARLNVPCLLYINL